MKKKGLLNAKKKAEEVLTNALMEYVRENGEEMCDYFYNEFGMEEEDEEGVKITKVLNTSQYGCFFSCQFDENDDSLNNISRDDEGFEIFDKVENSFGFSTYWAFYIVQDAEGNERLKYYRFYNNGVCYQDDSEPDHDYVERFSLAELNYIINVIVKNE